MTPGRSRLFLLIAAASLFGGACASPGDEGGSGGAPASGGTTGSGGKTASGGTTASGGVTASGGMTASGGITASGGTTAASGGKPGLGGATASGGASASGGSDGSGGARGEGGSGEGGRGLGGRGAGGRMGMTASGGSTSTAGTSGTASGGSSGSAGTSGGTGTPGNYPLGNAPVKSAGCGTTGNTTLVSGGTAVANGLATSKRLKITSSGNQREYIIDIPADYDNTKPYRLFYTSHWIGSTDTAVATGSVSNGGATNWGFYGLHREAMAANAPAIFVAPQSMGSTWQQSDHALFDDIVATVKSSLCIDESRVFATGFSFGGMITYSLSTNHQKVLRAAVGIAPANYNIYLPSPLPRDPIAWMSTTGMMDGTCPWNAGNAKQGGESIAKQRGTDNGCMVPTGNLPTWTSASPTRHICYDFTGCKSNYPVKACTFNGNHQAAPYDGGSGDNGLTSWIPTESWKFFTQF